MFMEKTGYGLALVTLIKRNTSMFMEKTSEDRPRASTGEKHLHVHGEDTKF